MKVAFTSMVGSVQGRSLMLQRIKDLLHAPASEELDSAFWGWVEDIPHQDFEYSYSDYNSCYSVKIIHRYLMVEIPGSKVSLLRFQSGNIGVCAVGRRDSFAQNETGRIAKLMMGEEIKGFKVESQGSKADCRPSMVFDSTARSCLTRSMFDMAQAEYEEMISRGEKGWSALRGFLSGASGESPVFQAAVRLVAELKALEKTGGGWRTDVPTHYDRYGEPV
jgi:hypothetical protein